MSDQLTPLQALNKLMDRWHRVASDLLALRGRSSSPESQAKAAQYARAIKACRDELRLTLEGVEDGALLAKQPQPHETGDTVQ